MIINRKIIFFLFLSVILFVLSFYSKEKSSPKVNSFTKTEIIHKENSEKEAPPVPQYPFKTGEKLKYGIYSSGIKVGRAVITYVGKEEIEGVLVDFVTLEASAPGFYDSEKIFGNIENFSPVKVEREISLFGEKISITEEYNPKNNEVLITRKAKKITENRISSKDKLSHIILLLYSLRYKKEFKIGQKLEFNLPTKKLEIVVDRETKIKVPKGRFDSIFIKSIPPRFKVWFSRDADNIPLRIEGAIGFGNTYLALIDYE